MSTYVRKTRDEFEVQGNYGYGYECVTSKNSRAEARARLREYQQNEPGIHFIIKKRRVRIQEGNKS